MKELLLKIYREQMSPPVDPCDVTLIRWCERIERVAEFNVAWRGWSSKNASVFVEEVKQLLAQWREEMPTWVIEIPCFDGTEISRHIKAPTYEQAMQLWD